MNKVTRFAILFVVFTMLISSLSTGLLADLKDGAVVDSGGRVVGYSYGGLYWDADEYEEMLGSAAVRSYAVTRNIPAESGDVLDEDDELLVTDVVCGLGMAIAITIDEDGNHVTYLGGYTFVEEDGVSLGELMNRLETWNMYKSPYEAAFFSRDWAYKAVKVMDGEQDIFVDTENQIVNFYITEKISELDPWDIYYSLRIAVNNTAE